MADATGRLASLDDGPWEDLGAPGRRDYQHDPAFQLQIMRLNVVPGQALRGRPLYVLGDHAFNFHAAPGADPLEVVDDAEMTSLALDTLQIEVSLRTRRCLWLWGYSPRRGWLPGRIQDPAAEDGGVEVADVELMRGVSPRIPDAPIREVFDRGTGWFGVFATAEPRGRAVRISTDTVLFVEDGAL
jgi:hypothetical protein